MTDEIKQLKEIIAQSHTMSMGGPMLSSTIGTRRVDPLTEALGDTSAYRQDLEYLKSQMQDIKNEKFAIEHEMENKMKSMTIANQQRKYLPKSITEEIEEAKSQTMGNPQVTEVLTGYDRTRKAVMDKLGGEFDYVEFDMDIKDLMSDKDNILNDFRKTKLNIPLPAPKGVKKYNFKTRPLKKKEGAEPVKPKIKIPEPKDDISKGIRNNEGDAPSKIIKQPQTLPVGSTQKPMTRPSSRPQRNIKPSDYTEHGKNIHIDEEMQDKKVSVPETDLLTIKKMVVEEIKKDLQTSKVSGKYVDPFKRRDNIEGGIDHIETVGMRAPESEETKLRNLKREKHRRDIEAGVADKNYEETQEIRDKLLDAVTDLVLEDYINHGNYVKQMEGMNEEQRQYFTERDNVSNFMASLNQSRNFAGESIDPDIRDIGEEIFNERIDGIFKDLEKQKKQETITKKSFERQRTIQGLIKSSTQQFDKAKKRIEFKDEQSWDGSDNEETKTRQQKREERSKERGKIKDHQMRTIEEQSEEQTPQKVNVNQIPVGAGRPSQQIIEINETSGPSTHYVHYVQPPAQQFAAQPGFNLGDLQHIVQNVIANEMKKNVNYLERRNNYVGAPVVQQPEVFETYKLPNKLMSDDEARLLAEENELKKGIPINIAPYVQQTLGINVNRPINAGYTNPFLGGVNPSTGLNPPRLVNLDDYDLSSESELFSEDADRTFSEAYSDPNVPGKTKGKHRYDIVRDSEDNKNQLRGENQMLDSANFKPKMKPGVLVHDLDPEIEALKRSYKKKGRIEINEEDEDDL
jgi:hypothetical protein